MLEEADDPPEGYALAKSRSLFSQRQGPYYYRFAGEVFCQALRVKSKHCNGAHVVHGGMISAIADNAMAGAVYHRLGRRALTVQMNVQFLQPSRAGDWLEGRGRVSHMTRHLVFCEAELFADDRLVARASGIFKRPAES